LTQIHEKWAENEEITTAEKLFFPSNLTFLQFYSRHLLTGIQSLSPSLPMALASMLN